MLFVHLSIDSLSTFVPQDRKNRWVFMKTVYINLDALSSCCWPSPLTYFFTLPLFHERTCATVPSVPCISGLQFNYSYNRIESRSWVNVWWILLQRVEKEKERRKKPKPKSSLVECSIRTIDLLGYSRRLWTVFTGRAKRWLSVNCDLNHL